MDVLHEGFPRDALEHSTKVIWTHIDAFGRFVNTNLRMVILSQKLKKRREVTVSHAPYRFIRLLREVPINETKSLL